MEGPMTPGNLGPKTTKLFKSLKIMKIIFFDNWKSSASKFCGRSTERELQIIDMVILGAKSVFGNL